MSQDVISFIENLSLPWQAEVGKKLRLLVHEAIPEVEERIQYKNRIFSKRTLCSRDFTFQRCNRLYDHEHNQSGSPPNFEGPPERKWLKIRKDDTPDYEQLSELLVQASSSL